jgi:hypothetical protein
MGEYRVAHSICSRITEFRPQHHSAWFGIAYYAMRLGKPVQNAVEALRVAHQLAPMTLTYRTNLASLFVQQGNIREAYELICDVPVDAIECPRMLRGLLPAIEAWGHESLVRSYRRRLTH